MLEDYSQTPKHVKQKFQSVKDTPRYRTSSLTPVMKQKLWQGIKTLNPALAELMKNDTDLKLLIDSFQGEFAFTEAEINYYTNEAKP
jgi:hypothetical protein